MPAPFSPTGEDYAEVSITGAEFLIKKTAQRLREACIGKACRGEFSRRALERNKTSVFEVKEIAKAFKIPSFGGMQSCVRNVSRTLVVAEAKTHKIENCGAGKGGAYNKLLSKLNLLAATNEMFIVGRSNAGKSSLFNAITASKSAIVANSLKTTRDVLSIRFGRVLIYDTPGIETEVSGAETKALTSSVLKASAASVLIIVASDAAAFYRTASNCVVVKVRSKIDLVHKLEENSSDLAVSAYSLEGVPTLRRTLILLSSKMQHLCIRNSIASCGN